LLEPLGEGILAVLEHEAWAAEAVVVAEVMARVLPHADPAELVAAFLAGHVVATVGLFNGRFAVRALSMYSGSHT
jgi:hypothetical protein